VRVSGVGSGSTPGESAPQAPARGDFASVLRSALREPEQQLNEVRSVIAAIRDGRAIAAATVADPAEATYARRIQTWAARGRGSGDPFGWRALTRQLGDQIVGPGFGSLFERQIEQESGYDPAVVFGVRRSSAGAEGIAQLMPQYYPHVDRRDPESSLRTAAATMRQHLDALGGDVRKALAAYNAGVGACSPWFRRTDRAGSAACPRRPSSTWPASWVA